MNFFSLYCSSSRAHTTADLFNENACKLEFSMPFDFLVENFNWIIFILFSTVNICGNIQDHHFSFAYMKNHAQINLRLLVANNLWKSLVISTLSLTNIKIISHINEAGNEIFCADCWSTDEKFDKKKPEHFVQYVLNLKDTFIGYAKIFVINCYLFIMLLDLFCIPILYVSCVVAQCTLYCNAYTFQLWHKRKQ